MSTIQTQILVTNEDYEKYIKTFPPERKTELRFPSSTAFTKRYGVTTIGIFDRKEGLYVLVPYFVSKSHEESIDPNVRDTPDLMARFCILNETGLEVKGKVVQLGNHFSVKNTDDSVPEDYFHRYVMLADGLEGELLTEEQVVSEKNGAPVLVHERLLPRIFEEQTIVEGELRRHRQYYAYERLKSDYLLVKW